MSLVPTVDSAAERDYSNSKIDSRVQDDDPVSAVCLRDAAEVRTVDVRVRVGEVRPVQHIDGIGPEFELLSFADANAFDEVDVEANLARPFEIAGMPYCRAFPAPDSPR